MPRYDYWCPKGCLIKPVEISHGINDPTTYKCPLCEGQMERLIGSCNFILKGGGFYTTDNNKGSAPK